MQQMSNELIQNPPTLCSGVLESGVDKWSQNNLQIMENCYNIVTKSEHVLDKLFLEKHAFGFLKVF